jgi:hypothetical protein
MRARRRFGAAILGLAALALLLGGVGQARAGFSITITADENGNGTLTNTSGFSGSLPFMTGQDPGPGGRSNALMYGLLNPPGLTAGDLVVIDPSFKVSDVIRFDSTAVVGGGTGAMAFYSRPGGTDLADQSGFPTALYSNANAILEPSNGQFSYTPTAGQPGFVAGAGGPVTYNLTSPELSPGLSSPSQSPSVNTPGGSGISPDQFSITITADENGNGTLTNTAGFSGSLPFMTGQDPGPGGRSNALMYGLLNPPGLTAGDFIVIDPSFTDVSDLIRYDPTAVVGGGTGAMAFYSRPGGTDLADQSGFPTALYDIGQTQVIVEPSNGQISNTPTAGQPGFVAGAGGPVTYNLTSPELSPPPASAPEPSSVALMGLGGLTLAAWRRWRRRTVAA